jgi:formylglycine-generating enzyme required for sulfatase activity
MIKTIHEIDGSYRVIRGGSWSHDAVTCTVSYRSYLYPNFRYGDLGFRVLRRKNDYKQNEIAN